MLRYNISFAALEQEKQRKKRITSIKLWRGTIFSLMAADLFLSGISGGMFVPIQTHHECEFKVTLWKFQISSCFFCPNGRLYFIGFLCHWRPLECDRSYLEVNLRTLEMRPVARLLTLASDGDRHRAPSDRPRSAFFCFFRSFLR